VLFEPGGDIVVPATISGAGAHAVRRFLNFFAATIRNRNTREACYRPTCSFDDVGVILRRPYFLAQRALAFGHGEGGNETVQPNAWPFAFPIRALPR